MIDIGDFFSFSVCPAGTFGNGCHQKCTWCEKGQFCDHITGQCLAITCPPGFTGHTCQKGNDISMNGISF